MFAYQGVSWKSGGRIGCRFLLCSGCGILAGTESLVCEVEAVKNKALEHLRREDLLDLIEIYAKNWLAMDGVWFQSMEKAFGMEEAMLHDAHAWERFTVIEARRIKTFLKLPEHPGLEGLRQALSLRFYACLNQGEFLTEGNSLTYRVLSCMVQTARTRKGMALHPCKPVGEIEYGLFAKAIDGRLACECLSCYPEVRDAGCSLSLIHI